METGTSFVVMVIESLIVGGLFLLYPRIARKGLLFGVYVGEKQSESPSARAITVFWYRGMVAAIVASLACGVTLALAAPHPLMAPVPLLILLCGFLLLYLRSYFKAKALAAEGPPPPAVAPVVALPVTAHALCAVALTFGAACGVFSIAYASTRYAELPSMVPTHFGPTGQADAFRPKSFATVMLLPILVLVLGTGLGGLAWLTAHAKRALRLADGGASLEAQIRFRTAVARFLCGIAMLTAGLLSWISIASVRVALGLENGLPPGVWFLAIALVLYALGGAVYLALRYGQGGSLIERATASTPLTDGLAENRRWVLGVFYVNREDPSILVERRFGLGYTINFGNWRAVALFGLFVALVLGIVLLARMSG